VLQISMIAPEMHDQFSKPSSNKMLHKVML
jgi:hypothetical protein